ncbi:hypothetical protein ABW20_dc0103162 [Dactylellina cionopaga]|nr:hypothetical protein ABW20_dc0103162 [Dactylellina cionopaga]
MKFFSTVIVAILSVAVMAAPAADPVANLEKRGCPAGVICISGKCHYWYCGPFGCSTGGATGQVNHRIDWEERTNERTIIDVTANFEPQCLLGTSGC